MSHQRQQGSIVKKALVGSMTDDCCVVKKVVVQKYRVI
jgi:hypothetical protein